MLDAPYKTAGRSLLQLDVETDQGARTSEDVLQDILSDEEQKRVLGRSTGGMARLFARTRPGRTN